MTVAAYLQLLPAVAQRPHKDGKTNAGAQFFSEKSRQIPRTRAGTNSLSPLNSLVKKV